MWYINIQKPITLLMTPQYDSVTEFTINLVKVSES